MRDNYYRFDAEHLLPCSSLNNEAGNYIWSSHGDGLNIAGGLNRIGNPGYYDFMSAPTGRITAPGLSVGFPTADFTIHAWVFRNGTAANSYMWGQGDSTLTPDSTQVYALTSDAPRCVLRKTDSTFFTLTSSVALVNNVWTHVAFVRSSGVMKIYVDGVERASGTTGTLLENVSPFSMGCAGEYLSNFFNGAIQDLEVARSALWTSGFTPPTRGAPPAISSSTETFMQGRSDLSPIMVNTPSVTLNGVVQGVGGFGGGGFKFSRVQNSSARLIGKTTTLGTDDFTIDFWINVISKSANADILSNRDSGTRPPILFFLDAVNGLRFLSGFGTDWWTNNLVIASLAQLTTGVWHHVAVTRTGDTWKGFFDGVQTGTGPITNSGSNLTGFSFIRLGGYTGLHFDGSVSNVRITKGIRLFTEDFHPRRIVF